MSHIFYDEIDNKNGEATPVTNEVPIFGATVSFVRVNVNNLCKNQLVSVKVEFFDGRDTFVVLFKTKR